jgi:hypothetical protein
LGVSFHGSEAAVEVGHVKHKSVREFLRAADVLIADMQNQKQPFSSVEMLILRAYVERIKSVFLKMETGTLQEKTVATLDKIHRDGDSGK